MVIIATAKPNWANGSGRPVGENTRTSLGFVLRAIKFVSERITMAEKTHIRTVGCGAKYGGWRSVAVYYAIMARTKYNPLHPGHRPHHEGNVRHAGID